MKGIRIISAPSILGLKPNGVEHLAEKFLGCGLAAKVGALTDVLEIPTLNHLYSGMRDPQTLCLNLQAIHDFSLGLNNVVATTIESGEFPLVLGGDCSILLGIMPALKSKGNYGLVFIDAHADFYQPEKSETGEVADMDLALVTGRGPEILTNIKGRKPYVQDTNVVHIGQRDWEQTKEYGSQDIRETTIHCLGLDLIRKGGINIILGKALTHINAMPIDGFWIHFDTDVLDDAINPAVDYRLPGGLAFDEVQLILTALLATGKAAGVTVTIYNPSLDSDRSIAENITDCLGKAFVKGFGAKF